MIKYLETNDFDKIIANNRILVDFYADWCGPCKMQGEILKNISSINILKINVDKYPELAKKYGILSIPTLAIFQNGILVKSHVGMMNINELNNFIKL